MCLHRISDKTIKNENAMSIRVSVWDKILKVIIAVASAIAGVIGGQVMAV